MMALQFFDQTNGKLSPCSTASTELEFLQDYGTLPSRRRTKIHDVCTENTTKPRNTDAIRVGICYLITSMIQGFFFSTLWLLLRSLGGADTTSFTVCVVALSAGSIFSSPVIGWLSDVRGYRIAFTLSQIILTFGTLMYALSNSVNFVIAARFIIGVGSGSFGVVLSNIAKYAAFGLSSIAGAYSASYGRHLKMVDYSIGPFKPDQFSFPATIYCAICFLSVFIAISLPSLFPSHPSVSLSIDGETKLSPRVVIEEDNNAAEDNIIGDGLRAPMNKSVRGSMFWKSCALILLVKACKTAVQDDLFSKLVSHGTNSASYVFIILPLISIMSLLMVAALSRFVKDSMLVLVGLTCLLTAAATSPFCSAFTTCTYVALIGTVGSSFCQSAIFSTASKLVEKSPHEGFLMGILYSCSMIGRDAVAYILRRHSFPPLPYPWWNIYTSPAVTVLSLVVALAYSRQAVDVSEERRRTDSSSPRYTLVPHMLSSD